MKPLIAAVVLVLLGPAVVSGYTKAYDVVPFRNCVATAPPDAEVSQYLRNTLDSLSAVSVWIGDTVDTSSYNVDVYDSVTTLRVAYGSGHQHKNWAWADFPLTREAQSVRGRTYKVVVSRPSGQAISFAYCDTNPYRYGRAVANGSTPTLPPTADVALRVTGVNRPTDSVTDWGATDV